MYVCMYIHTSKLNSTASSLMYAHTWQHMATSSVVRRNEMYTILPQNHTIRLWYLNTTTLVNISAGTKDMDINRITTHHMFMCKRKQKQRHNALTTNFSARIKCNSQHNTREQVSNLPKLVQTLTSFTFLEGVATCPAYPDRSTSLFVFSHRPRKTQGRTNYSWLGTTFHLHPSIPLTSIKAEILRLGGWEGTGKEDGRESKEGENRNLGLLTWHNGYHRQGILPNQLFAWMLTGFCWPPKWEVTRTVYFEITTHGRAYTPLGAVRLSQSGEFWHLRQTRTRYICKARGEDRCMNGGGWNVVE